MARHGTEAKRSLQFPPEREAAQLGSVEPYRVRHDGYAQEASKAQLVPAELGRRSDHLRKIKPCSPEVLDIVGDDREKGRRALPDAG